jgi:hypothetical protein
MAPVKTTGIKHENDEKKNDYFNSKSCLYLYHLCVLKLFKMKKRGT